MPHQRHIELLLTKAAQDEYVLDKLLPDADAPVEAFGFHAQQAAEKLLKAIIVAAGSEYGLTHQLADLMDAAREAGADVPSAFDDLRYLTPFAVQFRYDVFPDEPEEPVDKAHTRQLVRDLRTWAEAFVHERDEE
jgi:HEPN domain-containing protein